MTTSDRLPMAEVIQYDMREANDDQHGGEDDGRQELSGLSEHLPTVSMFIQQTND